MEQANINNPLHPKLDKSIKIRQRKKKVKSL